MSDELNTVENAPAIEATSDVSPEPQGDIFADANFDKEFGLEPENGQSDESQPDEKVTDPPATRQSEEVTPKQAEEEVKTATADETKTEAEPTDESLKFNEKLNWDDDKVPFREEYKNLKQAYLELAESSVEAQFLGSPNEFKDWMKQKSPTSYNEVGALLAQESAEMQPKEWLEFFAENNPDLLAEIASGREGMTQERLKAELEVLLDEDDDDVQATIEKNRAGVEAKPKETPQEQRVREVLEREERRELTAIQTEVFQPIEREIDSLVSNAGLEYSEQVDWNKFDQLDEEAKFKIMINEFIPFWIGKRVENNPSQRSMQARLEEFINKKDKTSAANLSHPAKIAATNYAGEVLSILTGKKAQTKKAETESPTKQIPQPIVKAANASHQVPQTGAIDWSGAA
jgi:hypothetical protein